MTQLPAGFSNRPGRDPEPSPGPSAGLPVRTVRAMLSAVRRVGAGVVALVAGPRMAGGVAGFETILGATVLGAAGALLAWTAGWRRMHLADAVEIGAGLGACLGTILHLLNLAFEDHAKEKKRRLFGDN